MKIAVVGCGFSGLIWAERIKRQGHQVVIFENKQQIGGVWKQAANKTSRVQMVSEDYGFAITQLSDNAKTITNFTPRDEILNQAQTFFESVGLDELTRFGATVTQVEKSREGYKVHYTHEQLNQIEHFDAVVLLPGSLIKQNSASLQSATGFTGIHCRGISDDIEPTEFAGKNVVIVGMGSYAVENARTAIEHGAKHVTIVARSYNIVAPKYMSYLISTHLNWKGDEILEHLNTVYSSIDREDLLEKLEDGKTHAQKTIPPISDIYFIAQKFGKLSVKKGSVERLEQRHVVLDTQESIPADVVLECNGFDRKSVHKQFASLLDCYTLNGMFVNNCNRFAFNFEPIHGGFDVQKGIPLASHLTITRMLADLFLYYLDKPEEFEKVKSHLPATSDASRFSGAFYTDTIATMIESSKELKKILLFHLACKTQRSRQHYSEAEFIQANKREWKALCRLCGGSEKEFPYPFTAKKRCVERLVQRLTYLYSKKAYQGIFGS